MQEHDLQFFRNSIRRSGRELQAAKRRAGQYEVKYRLKQRIRVLNDMINESRLTVYELEHYHDREEGANGGREAV